MYQITSEMLKKIGIIVLDSYDDIFNNVQLPKNWSKKASLESSYWSYLYDEKNRQRASIFYKAAFYDRAAHINFIPRFLTYLASIDETSEEYYPVYCKVIDNSSTKIIWVSDIYVQEYPKENREEFNLWSKAEDFLIETGKIWLNEHYPEWKNPMKYWEE